MRIESWSGAGQSREPSPPACSCSWLETFRRLPSCSGITADPVVRALDLRLPVAELAVSRGPLVAAVDSSITGDVAS